MRDFVFSFLKNDSVIHFQRCEDSLLEKLAIRFSGSLCDNDSQDNVAGIAVRPTRSRRELSVLLLLQQFQDFFILNLFFR